MTTRTSRPTATASQLQLLREGEITVRVIRPWDPPLPEGLIYGYSSRVLAGRRAFYPAAHGTQSVRVSYRVWSDPLMLADLARRSLANKSGEAVRGYATARAGVVDLGMSEQAYLHLAQAAANRDGHRAVEGPVSCRVKLLEPLVGMPASCQHCGLGLDAHDLLEDVQKGRWIGGRTRDAHHDPDAERIDRYYLCPQVSA